MVVKRLLVLVVSLAIYSSMFAIPSARAVIYVDATGGGDYTDIQSAINAAGNGDTIYVRNGIYSGGIIVDKSVIIIGESWNAVIMCDGNDGIKIYVNATIDGIAIKNSTSGHAGIIMYAQSVVKNCNFSYNYEAIHMVGVNHGMVLRNVFFENNYGITAINSYYNTIRENYFIDNQKAISFGTDTSDNVMYYNNFLRNVVDADDESGLNYWDYEHVGNYWDRYNGVDSDGDGIGDTPYKIDEEKGIQDHYPLMQNYTGVDIFPPDIMNLKAIPQIQIPNENVNITCGIIDNVEVNAAFINITFPNGSYINCSLNRIGNTYYFNSSFSLKGVYYYYVWANDTNNNSVKTALRKFVIAYKPAAHFIYFPSSPTDLDIVEFNSTSYDSDGIIVNYTWVIYNTRLGTTIKFYERNISYNFPDDGIYNVSLIVTDNDGAWNTTWENIDVMNIPPIANLSWHLLPPFYPIQPYVGQQINFSSKGYDPDGTIRQWKWYFGDGNSRVTTKNYTIYSYSKNGIFNITLVITDNDYGETTITKSITIYDIFPPSIKNLTAYPNPQEIGNMINISCDVFDDVGVAAVEIHIRKPDGTFINESMMQSSRYYVIINGSEAGNYTYYITAIDVNGNGNASKLQNFTVIVPPSPPAIMNVSISPGWQVEYGSDVNITCSVIDNVGVGSVVIDLNGNKSMSGITDAMGNGIYYYSAFLDTGNYQFKIYATDINGYVNVSRLFNFSIVDTTPPRISNISFSSLFEPGWHNISCSVYDAKGVGDVRINISMPNRTINVSMLPSYYFNFNYSVGHYSFYIWACDVSGNENRSAVYNFTVTEFPVANFTWQPSQPYDTDTIQFYSFSYDSDGYIVNYIWNFGDGSISHEQNPGHRYMDDGTYNITLAVTDNDGAMATITKSISIANVPPVANFTWQPSQPFQMEIITFNSSSYDSDGYIANYTWQFGDGGTAYGSIVNHVFENSGTYNVGLIVIDDDGSEATITKSINIANVPPSCIITYPNNKSIVNGTITIHGNASDDKNVVRVEIRIDNNAWHIANGTTTWNYTIDTTLLSNGLHRIEARSYDGSLYSNIATIFINVSNIHDVCLINFTNAINGIKITYNGNVISEKLQTGQQYRIWYMLSNNGTFEENVSIEIKITNDTFVESRQSFYFLPAGQSILCNITWNTSGLKGKYEIFINATIPYNDVNPVNNIINRTVVVVVPIRIENISIVPLQQYENGFVNISCNVYGDILVVGINITYPDGSHQNLSISYGYYINQSYSMVGTYSFFIWAKDKYGNENVSSMYSFEIISLNQPPSCIITYPNNKSIVNGTITIHGNASDDKNVVRVEIRIDNNAWHIANGTTTWNYTIDTTLLSNGLHRIEARSYDGSLYSNIATIFINVINIDFEYSPSPPASNEIINFYANFSASNYTWNFGDGGIAYGCIASHFYKIGNFYDVKLVVKIGNITAEITKEIKVDTKITLVKNANNVVNFVSWTSLSSIKASALAQMIGYPMQVGSVISKWNTSKGSYDDYIVGISPPAYDFTINPGDAIVLRVSSPGSFIIPASHIHNRSVMLVKNANNVVNFVSWTSLSSIKASALAQMIGYPMQVGSVISKWNTSKGSYDDYIVGISPPAYDFTINPGDAIVLRVSSPGSFIIPEVIK